MKRPSRSYRVQASKANSRRGQKLLAEYYESVKDIPKGRLVATAEGIAFKKDGDDNDNI